MLLKQNIFFVYGKVFPDGKRKKAQEHIARSRLLVEETGKITMLTVLRDKLFRKLQYWHMVCKKSHHFGWRSRQGLPGEYFFFLPLSNFENFS